VINSTLVSISGYLLIFGLTISLNGEKIDAKEKLNIDREDKGEGREEGGGIFSHHQLSGRKSPYTVHTLFMKGPVKICT
jgi:hypothetical protein